MSTMSTTSTAPALTVCLLAAALAGCPSPGGADGLAGADPLANARDATAIVVCAEPVDATEIDATQVEASGGASSSQDAIEADGLFACASCDCDCSQAACATAGCVAQSTGQGNCTQSGSACNGNTCSCDCYTVLGKACPAPGQGNRSPERITLTNGVNGVVAACAWK